MIRIQTLDQARELGFTEGAVDTVVEDGNIIAFVDGTSMDALTVKRIAEDLVQYKFIQADLHWEIEVFATHLFAALVALGMNDSYMEEWGDYNGLLKNLREHPGMIEVCVITTHALSQLEVANNVKAVMKGKS